MNALVLSRLFAGIRRDDLAAASGLDAERLRRAEEEIEPLSEAEESAREAAIESIIDERLARAAEGAAR